VVHSPSTVEAVAIPVNGAQLRGDLVVPQEPLGVVAFAHGSGSSRLSQRNLYVAAALQQASLATLLLDLQAAAETRSLVAAIDWCADHERLRHLPVGLYGASTGAAAALEAAVARPGQVGAVVSRGGRPDLAFEALGLVRCPTLLIVGSHDVDVLELNAWAAAHLRAVHDLLVVAGASHLFSEPGTLEQVAQASRDWFLEQLARQ